MHDLNAIVREKDPELPTIKLQKLKDGDHVVHHGADGIKLVARVSSGVISDWLAFGKDGAEGTSVVIRKPGHGHKSPAQEIGSANQPQGFRLPTYGWYIVCACFASGDFCWLIHVP